MKGRYSGVETYLTVHSWNGINWWSTTNAVAKAEQRASLIKGDYLVKVDKEFPEVVVYDRSGKYIGVVW
jgi:hypothetical protein